ncbi:MAG: FAD-binding oxidoreductase [Paracoccaceae bacterium]
MSGPRTLTVVAKRRESSLITSFHLAAEGGADLPPFRPGQFLVFRLQTPDGEVVRNYSLSGSPDAPGQYRISVKREALGAGSRHLHDQLQVGDRLVADGPRGAFVLDEDSPRPVVLLSGGVGLTPMVAMLHRLAAGSRRVAFVHACEDGAVHALRGEVSTLAASRPGITAHYAYRTPSDADRQAGHHHSDGLLTREVLQGLLCLDDYDFYLCGPPPFMAAIYPMLRSLGVPKARIAYEFFGPATVLEEGPVAAAPQPAPVAPDTGAITVEFRKSGITAVWSDAAESLLSLAEDNGLRPDFSCRAGICGTCKSSITAGEVDYFEEPLDELASGEVLLCCSRPKTSVVLDL